MDRNQILDEIKTLAMSQGFYSRLLQNINDIKEESEEKYEALMTELEKQNFKDSVDMILYFES